MHNERKHRGQSGGKGGERLDCGVERVDGEEEMHRGRDVALLIGS